MTTTFHLNAPPGRVSTVNTTKPGTLTAQRLKVTLVLNASELLSIPAPDGKPRVVLHIKLPERTVTADIAAKALRRAQSAIREAGADNVAVILQGNLTRGDAVAEAGLVAQVRAAKPITVSSAADPSKEKAP